MANDTLEQTPETTDVEADDGHPHKAEQPEVEGERMVTNIAMGIAAVIGVVIVWRLAVGFSGLVSFFEYIVDRWDNILEDAIDHTILTLMSIGLASAIAIPLGIAVMNNRATRSLALTVFGVLLTVPSLAFFSLLIPLVGIGKGPPVIALTIYAILPILRNTVTGLNGVDPAVIESAKGMGLGKTQRLLRVQLPLAWPVILTGIRVATILTISIAAIAILVNGGGLGGFIQNGINRFTRPTYVESIWTGNLAIILLALIFERLFAVVTRLTTSKGLQ